MVQAARGGNGVHPFEEPCARSTPLVPARDGGRPLLAHGAFSSSSDALDATFSLCAYTAVATALDINVDSQTRQRDLCHIDALFTNAEHYAIFPAADPSVAQRTARSAFTNASAIWASSAEFKASTVLMAHLEALETGSTLLANATWAGSDEAVNSDGAPTDYLSAQFMSLVRYYNDAGLLVFPTDCGGPWSCDALIDWPVQTRDGYVVSGRDTIRNGLGARALRALADLASWTGHAAAAVRYSAAADAIAASLFREFLRRNGSEAYFVDGPSAPASDHAAIHSTIYAIIGGADVSDPALAAALTAYLKRRDTGGSSCMTARWLLEALYTLGFYSGAAADAALELMSRASYPSWGFMIAAGATTTFEAWALPDKWNTDAAHPWCASPAFVIPRSLVGIAPLQPGWAVFRAAPQPGPLANATALVPTPRGDVRAVFVQQGSSAPGGARVSLALNVPPETRAQVCLPPLHAAFAAGGRAGEGERDGAAAGDELLVDGVAVATTPLGRLLCSTARVGPGQHSAVRRSK